MNTEKLSLTTESLIDLSKYNQSWFDRERPGWFILLWWLVQSITFPLSPQPFNSFRRFILRLFGAKIGKGVLIRPTARFTYPWKISIDDYAWIGDNVVLYSLDQISIGKHSVISQKSYLCTGSHDICDSAFGLIVSPIKIGNGVWIAADCFIAPGVEIASNTVIGARSSVFNPIPSQQVAWGNPCYSRYQRVINHVDVINNAELIKN